jgi:hypothetical protein
VTRTVKNPIISEWGVISGDLNHPVFSLVCSPTTGIVDWNTTIWSDRSPWGSSIYIRRNNWLYEPTPHTHQVRTYSRLSTDWRADINILVVDGGVSLTDGQLDNWERTIMRLYFEWKVSNLRWECCEFLRNLIKSESHPRTSYVFRSNAPTHMY